MTLIEIRSEFETSIRRALPEYNLFGAKVTRIALSELPCINLYFHKDCLGSKRNGYDDRHVTFVIEACFKPESDPELEQVRIWDRIDKELRLNTSLFELVTSLTIEDVDLGHDMVGEIRVAALQINVRLFYQRLYPSVPERLDPKQIIVNGEIINV